MTINRFVLHCVVLLLVTLSACSDPKADAEARKKARACLLSRISEVRLTVDVIDGSETSLPIELRNMVESKLRNAGLKINPDAEWHFQVKVMGPPFFSRTKTGSIYVSIRTDYYGGVYNWWSDSKEHSEVLAEAPQFISDSTDGFLYMRMKAIQQCED